MNRNILIPAVALALLFSAESAENADWFSRESYLYDANLGLDYDLPPVVDRSFDYMRDRERQHEEVLEQIGGTGTYEPEPDAGARALTEEATDDEPPFYGWHFDSSPKGPVRDYGWFDESSPRGRSSGVAERNQGQKAARTISGKIQSVRPVRLTNSEGATAEHTIIKLEFRDGRSVLVNLGPGKNPQGDNLGQGDSVEIIGSPGKIQDRRVFFARDVKVNRRGASTREANPDIPTTVQVRGIVEDSQRFFLYPGGQSKPLLRVRFENGRTALIDLGPETSWFDLEVEEDASVVVHGWPKTIDGRRVIQAKTISVNGDTMVLR